MQSLLFQLGSVDLVLFPCLALSLIVSRVDVYRGKRINEQNRQANMTGKKIKRKRRKVILLSVADIGQESCVCQCMCMYLNDCALEKCYSEGFYLTVKPEEVSYSLLTELYFYQSEEKSSSFP